MKNTKQIQCPKCEGTGFICRKFKNLNEKQIALSQTLTDLVEQGKTQKEIIEKLKIHPRTLRKYLEMFGLKPIRPVSYNAVPEGRNEEMLQFYLENNSMQKTGEKFGITRERVRQILKANGISKWKNRTRIFQPFKKSRSKTLTSKERFWNRVERLGVDDCWLWQGSSYNNRGHISLRGLGYKTRLYTYQVSYIFTHGKLPEGCWLTLKCKNLLCCNPKHIVPQTPKEVCANRRPRQRRKKEVGEMI